MEGWALDSYIYLWREVQLQCAGKRRMGEKGGEE